MATVTIPRKRILRTLDERGWIRDSWGTEGDGPVCLHGAIRLCDPADATLIEQVWKKRGYGTDWNDRDTTTELMVRQYVLDADPITDAELEQVFGPQWFEIVALVRRASKLTVGEVERLDAARDAAWYAARDAAGAAAGAAAWYAARDAARDAAWYAAGAAAWYAAWALVVRDLIGQHGYTQADYDTLVGPWESVIGKAHPDD